MARLSDGNFQGILADIHEDEGYEQYDLVLTVLDNIITDVHECLHQESKDKLYALVQLINACKPHDLFRFLPDDSSRSPYNKGEFECRMLGEFRLPLQMTSCDPSVINASEFIATGEDKPDAVSPLSPPISKLFYEDDDDLDEVHSFITCREWGTVQQCKHHSQWTEAEIEEYLKSYPTFSYQDFGTAIGRDWGYCKCSICKPTGGENNGS